MLNFADNEQGENSFGIQREGCSCIIKFSSRFGHAFGIHCIHCASSGPIFLVHSLRTKRNQFDPLHVRNLATQIFRCGSIFSCLLAIVQPPIIQNWPLVTVFNTASGRFFVQFMYVIALFNNVARFGILSLSENPSSSVIGALVVVASFAQFLTLCHVPASRMHPLMQWPIKLSKEKSADANKNEIVAEAYEAPQIDEQQ